MPPKKTKFNLRLKNSAMLPSYFDYILVHQRQKVLLRPELSRKFLSTLGPNPARTQPEKLGSIYNSATEINQVDRVNMIKDFENWSGAPNPQIYGDLPNIGDPSTKLLPKVIIPSSERGGRSLAP